MEFFKKRGVALAVLVVAIVGAVFIGQSRKAGFIAKEPTCLLYTSTKGHRAQGNFVEYKYLFFQKIIKFWYKTHGGYTRPLSARHMMWWRKTKRNPAKLSLTASYRPFPPFAAFSPRENPGTEMFIRDSHGGGHGGGAVPSLCH